MAASSPSPADYVDMRSTITDPSLDAKFRGNGTIQLRRSLRVWQLPQFSLVGEFVTSEREGSGTLPDGERGSGTLPDGMHGNALASLSCSHATCCTPDPCPSVATTPADETESAGFMTVQLIGSTGVAASGEGGQRTTLSSLPIKSSTNALELLQGSRAVLSHLCRRWQGCVVGRQREQPDHCEGAYVHVFSESVSCPVR